MATASSIPLTARGALKALENARNIMEMSRRVAACSPALRPAWAEPETSNLRIVRNLLLILLAVLLLPYLLTPFYRAGHPVSTLMAWRWLKGAPVSRQWIDFNAISPALPRSVVASEDAKFCSHHGIDWDALRDVIDDAEDGEVARGGSTITQQVAKNLFLWPGRSVIRKALETPAGDVDRSGAAEAADPGDLPQHRRTRARPGSSGPRPGRSTPSAAPAATLVAARGRPCWRRSCPIRSGAAPAIPAPGYAVWPGPIWRGRRPRPCSAAGAKIVLFEPISGAFNRKLA